MERDLESRLELASAKLVATPNGTIAFVYSTKRPYGFLEIISADQINIWSD